MTYDQATIHPPVNQPDSVEELLSRCYAISGQTLGDLATIAGIMTPENFKKHKGWTGQLIELWLGAQAGSKPEQDFAHLGIELKTLPITTTGKVLETTYVCYAHLTGLQGVTWGSSSVKNKLAQVLWVPIIGERQIPPAERQVGSPFLWRPSLEQQQQLKQDWEEHMEAIVLGKVDSLSAIHGQYLQIRPKAADGSKVTEVLNDEGEKIKTRPRGFYLRKQFTQEILNSAFDL